MSGWAGHLYRSIADYGFLSDCETTALVAPNGTVEWMCLPQLDSPSVFAALLDQDAGGFRLGPDGMEVPAARRYLPGTLALETSWETGGGWLVVLDALLIGPWHHQHERSQTHRRIPTDYDADHVLLRTVRCVSGQVQTRMDCKPVFDYGRLAAAWQHDGAGYHEAVATAEDGSASLRLTTDLNVGFEGPAAGARTLLKAGETRFVALSWTEHSPPRSYDAAVQRMRWTVHHWQHWLGRGQFPDHPWRGCLQRSALTLKGLTFAPTGGIAAAATTSIPETPGGERNWDYRYTWLRDATMVLAALRGLRFDWEANDFFFFITDAAEDGGGELQIMYGVDGRRELTEQTLDHLRGYLESRPVRIGNDAYAQNQHDAWGSVVGAIYIYTRHSGRLDGRLWAIVTDQVETALRHWREPDHGPWEVRGGPQHFTYSKVACWLAAQCGAELAEIRREEDRAKRWRAAAEEIRADVLTHAVDHRGALTQHYDTSALDAAMLMVAQLGFLDDDDERLRATVLAIADELTDHGLVLRYRPVETDDGLGGQDEGTFTICSFWLVSALVRIGELDRARALCGKLLGYAGPLGLFAEEIDPVNGSHLGNFPQALTHLALINAVRDIVRAERRLEGS